MLQTANRLREMITIVLPRLREIALTEARANPYPPKWANIEVLGHLIDSACNNHMKFIRAQQEPHTEVIGYAQNHWVDAQRYRDADWLDLLELWHLYNRHLADVIERVPAAKLSHTITIIGPEGPAGPFTLAFIMDDYIEHMKHHLLQIMPDAPLTHGFKNVYGA